MSVGLMVYDGRTRGRKSRYMSMFHATVLVERRRRILGLIPKFY